MPWPRSRFRPWRFYRDGLLRGLEHLSDPPYASRICERFPQIRFFELDLPAMIKAKQERVTRIFGAVPDRVALVGTDFNTHPLEEVLRAAGYDRTQRTFFIWEGVTMFLPEEVNRSTLARVP